MSGPDIAAKLDEARALIEKGWTKGDFERGDCYCALGALSMACSGRPDACSNYTGIYAEAADFLARIAGVPNDYQITVWNDAPERTQAEVIEAFRKAAELARQEQSA